MRIGRLLAAVTASALTFTSLAGGVSAAVPRQASNAVPVCPGPAQAGSARCHSYVVVGANGKPIVTNTTVNGYRAADLEGAYGLVAAAAAAGAGVTIAIVDAYNDPNAAKDLAVYRSTMGLPPCGSAGGCFRQVGQNGGSKLPRTNSGWALEISLDLDMASAICPNCALLLVEASSNSFADLGAAEDYAAAHASVVSNSWGASEFSGETGGAYDGHFDHPGVVITVSSGDNGYGVEYPAASQYVTAVGGTTLDWDAASKTRVSETAWSGAGSGCSAYEAKPAWQSGIADCPRRAVTDVSAVADPNTGVAVYDTVRYNGQSGWFKVGGTSAAAPIVAGAYALAGNASAVTFGSYPYSHTSALNDITSGSNGSCGGADLCTAGTGWDGPTGNGTPNGTGAF
ncbi:MAG: S53 family peptidase [Chloroflexota bacterium]|nr:S53 family peptidase [Chloroflexota bacterium]